MHFCGPFGPFFKGDFRHKTTTIVGNRGQLWTSTLSPHLLSPHLDFRKLYSSCCTFKLLLLKSNLLAIEIAAILHHCGLIVERQRGNGQRGNCPKKFPKGPKIEKFQDRPPGLKFSIEIEIFKRATHQTLIFVGNSEGPGLKISSEIEIFNRD